MSEIDSELNQPDISRTMTSVAARYFVLIGLTGSAVTLAAQEPGESGGFVVRHGRDTVATEQFTRTATSLEGTLSLRNRTQTSERYSAVIAPDATLPLIQITVREGPDSLPGGARVIQRARVIFREDSAAVDEVGGRGLVTQVFGTESGAVPYLNLSFALLEQAVRRARTAPSSSQIPFFNLGGGQTLMARISPLVNDSLRLDIGDIRYHLQVDSAGRILGARIPVQNVEVDRR